MHFEFKTLFSPSLHLDARSALNPHHSFSYVLAIFLPWEVIFKRGDVSVIFSFLRYGRGFLEHVEPPWSLLIQLDWFVKLRMDLVCIVELGC